jgi:hypothetical protein
MGCLIGLQSEKSSYDRAPGSDEEIEEWRRFLSDPGPIFRLSTALLKLILAQAVNKDARTKASSSRSTGTSRTNVTQTAKAAASVNRTWIVLCGLLFGLGVTGALLHALAPPPLTRDAAGLLAIGQEQPIEQVFDTPIAIKPGRWHWVYIHLGTAPVTAVIGVGNTSADHFTIVSGDSSSDSAIQTSERWTRQLPAGDVPGASMNSDCLSICLVGNDKGKSPTDEQRNRLNDLVTAIERQLGIAADHVLAGEGVQSPQGSAQIPLAASTTPISH